jgi:AmmeMemoRadiSam system protein A
MIAETATTRVLALARAALEAQVRRGTPPAIAADLVVAGSGVFVSVHCGDELRGCLGTLEAGPNLTHAIVRLAEDVAHRDYRFRAISVDELPRLSIELSILTAPELVHDPSTIEIGRDGLIVEQGRHRGLLLPQVATDHGWDRETFLAQTCVKAGLPGNAWRQGATIWRFRAEVFGDAPVEQAQ